MQTKRILGLLLVLAAVPGLAGVATPADEGAEDPRLKLPEPSFRQGASVAWEIELLPPPGWHINSLLPIVVSFDREALKGLPVALSQERFEFELPDYAERYVALVPFTVAAKAAEGEFSLPAQVDCGICTLDNSACTFAEAQPSVVLRVRHAAPKSEKNQAQAKGILRSAVQLLQAE